MLNLFIQFKTQFLLIQFQFFIEIKFQMYFLIYLISVLNIYKVYIIIFFIKFKYNKFIAICHIIFYVFFIVISYTTPLHIAVLNNRAEIVQLFLNKPGIKINIKNGIFL